MGKYSILYCDPPWSYDDKAMARGGAERHYKTMELADICALPVASLAAADCALFIWGTWPKLFECGDVIRAWGFTFKTCAFVWVKAIRSAEVNQSFMFAEHAFAFDESFWGMGRWTRANTEFCLLAVRGGVTRMNADVHQVIYSPILRHSEKPPEARERIVRLLGDLPRVELFARSRAPGWDVFGNQVEGSIEL